MPSVLIADDHCLVSQALQRIIDQSECAITVGIAGTLRQTEELLADLQPDILLLDIAMPDGDGIDALPQMRQVAPHTHIIILTMYAESAVINRAVNANADGYILKNTDAGELINAIQIVADNEKYICHEALQILKTTEKKDIAILTQREKDVLQLIVNGYSEKEIADKLFLSFETIHSYTKQIRRKLNCNNTASLVRTAIQQHLYIK